MSELALLSKGLPAHLRQLGGLDDMTKALMGGSGGGGGKRISIKGGVWRMVVDGKEVAKNEERSMNVVIVAAAPKVSRTYYEGTYNEGEVTSPACWSADGELPDATAKSPQGKSCATCSQNIKGSGQGDSRACRFSQRLAVVLENDVAGDVYQLTLPAQSIFGAGEAGKWPLQTYAKMLGSKGAPISSVVTEMRFDTNSATPKLTFKPARFLETEEFTQAVEQGKSPDAVKAITMTVAQTDGVKDSGEKFEDAPPVAKAPAKKVAAPVVEEEEIAEPVKRPSKKDEEAPAAKKDLSKLLDEWDDE
jgi:hypothetical protein